MDLDDILPHVGDWNKYQHIILWFVCLPACIPCGMAGLSQVFMDRTMDHWCKVPELVNAEWSVEQRKAVSIPKSSETMTHSQCEMYDLNYTAIVEGAGYPNTIAPSVSCRNGWEYDTSEVSSSIVIDFQLFCSRAFLPTMGLFSLNLGGLFGCVLFGYLNDRLGRKTNYFLCLTVMILFGIATPFAPDMAWWCIFRFFVGLTVPAILHIPFVICLEVVAPSKRTLVSFYSNMFYVAGLLGLSGLAYAFQSNWVWMSLATSAPFVLYYIYFFFMPESMRWLLAQGRIDEVVTMLKTIAKVNKKTVPEHIYLQFKETMEQQKEQSKVESQGKSASFKDLFRTPNMRMKTIIVSFSWVVNETVYVGLSYYGPAMGSDAFLSFFLSSVVEIPGYVLCLILMERWGRRSTLCLCMMVSGVTSISTALLPTEAQTATLIFYLVAKCMIAGGTMVIFQFGGELYPTEVRGVGIGLASHLGGIGLIIIPFVNYLGTRWLILPILIMGVFSLVGGIVSLILPETLNAKLPQTLSEGEEFGKDFSGWRHTIQQLSRWIPKVQGRGGRKDGEDAESHRQEGSRDTIDLRP